MASPQLERGFTRIANELLEAIIRADLNGTQSALCLAIIRETYGYGVKSRPLPVSRLCELTKRSKPTVSREMAQLIKLNIVVQIDPATFESPRTIALNKDFDGWKVTVSDTVIESETGIENETLTGIENETPSILLNKRVKKQAKKSGSFIPPTVTQAEQYASELQLPHGQGKAFVDYHEARGWMLGKSKMVSWKAALRTWKGNYEKFNPKPDKPQGRTSYFQ